MLERLKTVDGGSSGSTVASQQDRFGFKHRTDWGFSEYSPCACVGQIRSTAYSNLPTSVNMSFISVLAL